MTINEIEINVPPDQVFAVLADPDLYAEWVVGTDRIRDSDTHWPAPGARIHHSVGVGPLTIDDSTEVIGADPPGRLELLAHLGPLGSFHVELLLVAKSGGTHVTMTEGPVEGISRLAGPVGDAFGSARNKLSLGRLKELAERTRAAPG
ncbi:MAG TPA: SRPBCC domain-containing protein [Gaiellaceae bacterium]|nr:SRPBCC domain-containing protein [Gaiellaceae bacterium]